MTVNGKSQLMELDQSLPLDAVCRLLCADHGIRWRAGRYALQFTRQSKPTRGSTSSAQGGGCALKYVTELNRRDIAHGAELCLTYAPDVFSNLIAERLACRT